MNLKSKVNNKFEEVLHLNNLRFIKALLKKNGQGTGLKQNTLKNMQKSQCNM